MWRYFTHLEAAHLIPVHATNKSKREHTFIDDVAMLELRKIAMAYRPELVASPVKDLGCHAMYSQLYLKVSQTQP